MLKTHKILAQKTASSNTQRKEPVGSIENETRIFRETLTDDVYNKYVSKTQPNPAIESPRDQQLIHNRENVVRIMAYSNCREPI